MDFSPWNWATHFRLHVAACLIAGVMPVSKREPTSDELPPQARPILISLGSAYYEWYFQVLNPERPKAMSLKGVLNPDGTLPEFPVPTALAGEIVSRAAIREFISEMGHKSAYDFSPIEQKKPFALVEAEAGQMIAPQLLQPQAATLSPASESPAAPVVANSASGGMVELDYSMLATPAALLDAFEKWGMKAAWFDELDSHNRAIAFEEI